MDGQTVAVERRNGKRGFTWVRTTAGFGEEHKKMCQPRVCQTLQRPIRMQRNMYLVAVMDKFLASVDSACVLGREDVD